MGARAADRLTAAADARIMAWGSIEKAWGRVTGTVTGCRSQEKGDSNRWQTHRSTVQARRKPIQPF